MLSQIVKMTPSLLQMKTVLESFSSCYLALLWWTLIRKPWQVFHLLIFSSYSDHKLMIVNSNCLMKPHDWSNYTKEGKESSFDNKITKYMWLGHVLCPLILSPNCLFNHILWVIIIYQRCMWFVNSSLNLFSHAIHAPSKVLTEFSRILLERKKSSCGQSVMMRDILKGRRKRKKFV